MKHRRPLIMTDVSLSRPSTGLATVRTRRRILALALPVTAVLLLFGGALTPKGLDRPVTSLAGALRELQIAAAHPGQVYFSNVLVIFGLGTLGVSFFAIAVLASDRDRVLATTAAGDRMVRCLLRGRRECAYRVQPGRCGGSPFAVGCSPDTGIGQHCRRGQGVLYRIFRRYSGGYHSHRDRSAGAARPFRDGCRCCSRRA